MSIPYFYIIEHTPSGKKYAGAKWFEANPKTFMTESGYQTSSNVVKGLILRDGLSAFQIKELLTEDQIETTVLEYETKFLKQNDCARSEEWLNLHNNHNKTITLPPTKETKQKIAKSIVATCTVKCEYCDVVSSPGNIKRWHNDNCLSNPKNANLVRIGTSKGMKMSEEAKANMRKPKSDTSKMGRHIRSEYERKSSSERLKRTLKEHGNPMSNPLSVEKVRQARLGMVKHAN